MAGSTRAAYYEIYLKNGVINSLKDTESQALKLDNVMKSLNDTMRIIGAGFAIPAIKNTIQEWVQETADYENSLIRIRNVSDSVEEGIKNQFFIRQEVDRFKLDLQSATEAYGDFLTMVRGSGLAADDVRKLHDEVLLIGKVTGLANSQMDAGVRNLGKLLEQGTLESRHLRPLTYQFSGLMPYISKELGMTNQQLEKAMSSGKLTRAAVDSKVLTQAISAYADDLRDKLPEALNSTQSSLNQLNTSWLEFKSNLILGAKPELQEFIGTLREGIHWLDQHRDLLYRTGKLVINLAAGYLVYKTAILGINTAQLAYKSVSSWILGNTVAQTSAYGSQTLAVNSLAASIERLNFVQNAQNASFITNSAGVTMANTVGNRYAMSAEAAAVGSGVATAEGATVGSMLAAGAKKAVILVAITEVLGQAAEFFKLYGFTETGHRNTFHESLGLSDWNTSPEAVFTNKLGLIHRMAFPGLPNPKIEESQKILDNAQGVYGKYQLKFNPDGSVMPFSQAYPFADVANMNMTDRLGNWDKSVWERKKLSETNKGVLHDAPKLGSTSAIRGNSVTTINITIKEMNGLNHCTFEVKNMKDYSKIKDSVGNEMVRELTDAVNDSQLIRR